MQDFGSPSKNGHKVVNTTNPLTRQRCEAVFIPTLAAGQWKAELSINNKIESEEMIDNDRDALRAGQV